MGYPPHDAPNQKFLQGNQQKIVKPITFNSHTEKLIKKEIKF